MNGYDPMYGQGYGRGSSMYRYNRPSISQYESFFEPIPLEYLQGIADRHQQKYDTAYASALAGKTSLNEIEVGDQDLARRNELVGQVVSGIQDRVANQYGGDWARAGKDVARIISSVREDPFWDLAKTAQSERARQASEVSRLGDKAYILQDANRSVYDPETGTYNPVRSEIVNMQDWQDSVRKQFEGIRGDKLEGALRASGVKGILQSTTVEELSESQLRALANNPEIINTFLTNNPSFQKVKEHEGFSNEEMRQEAANYIYGNIAAKKYRSVTKDNVSDPSFNADGGGGGGLGTFVTNVGEAVNLKGFSRQEAANNRTNLINQQRTLSGITNRTPEQEQMLQSINSQLTSIDSNNRFLFRSMQADPNLRLDIDKLYDDYVRANKLGVRPMNKQQFEETLMNDVLTNEDRTPRGLLRTNFVQIGHSRFGAGGLSSAVRQARRNFDKYIEEGKISQSVNILNGTTGRAAVDTRIGRNNEMLTQAWRNSSSGYSVPYGNQQIASVLETDSRYKNKRDPTKDTVVMTDGSINGKFMYQLNIFDKDGKLLGSEYIIPQQQENIQSNLMRIAEDIAQHGYQEDAVNIIKNVAFGPAIQNANIYTQDTGAFEGVTYYGNTIHFKNEGTKTSPIYTFYIKKPNGEEDFFENITPDGQRVKFTAQDEAGIKQHLYNFYMQQRATQ